MTTARRGADYTPQRHQQRHRVLLVHNEYVVLTENHPDTGPVIPILSSLLLDTTITHAFVAGIKLYEPLARLNQMMQYSIPGWRMRITNRQRRAFLSNGEQKVTGRFFVDYIVIQQTQSNGTKQHTKRRALKKLEMINLDLLKERPPLDPQEQMDIVLALLEMCDHRGVRMRGTRGSLGTALLKASPDWNRYRKPAPRFINKKVRNHLPGNFYSLSEQIQQTRGIKSLAHCFYLDQSNAHHSIASTVSLPHPESVHARGYYKNERGHWARSGSELYKSILENHQIGLVLCKIHVSSAPPKMGHMVPPWAKKRGDKYSWLWTPELRLLQDEHRFQLDHFVAGFTATQRDLVLREYAKWALTEIDDNPERAAYKKGSLLAAYGMLAFNNDKRVIYRYWGDDCNGPRVSIPGAGPVRERRLQLSERFQPSTINVLARGIIESETRTRSLEYAKELYSQGYHVPQIYADGLLVETDRLPFLRDGWRVSHSLTNVYFPRNNAIISDQIVKLPGNTGSNVDHEWERRREESKQPYPVKLGTPETDYVIKKAVRRLARLTA